MATRLKGLKNIPDRTIEDGPLPQRGRQPLPVNAWHPHRVRAACPKCMQGWSEHTLTGRRVAWCSEAKVEWRRKQYLKEGVEVNGKIARIKYELACDACGHTQWRENYGNSYDYYFGKGAPAVNPIVQQIVDKQMAQDKLEAEEQAYWEIAMREAAAKQLLFEEARQARRAYEPEEMKEWDELEVAYG